MQYICWEPKRMPEFKYMIRPTLGRDYMLCNDIDEAYQMASEMCERNSETTCILQRAIDGNGEWKSKMIARFYPPDPDPEFNFGIHIEEIERPRMTVHFQWWCESGQWLNAPEGWEPCDEYKQWQKDVFGK